MFIELTEEQSILRDTLRKLGKDKLERLTIESDRADRFDHESLQLLKEIGIFGLPAPSKYGGSETNITTLTIVLEELGYFSPSMGCTFIGHLALVRPLFLGGNRFLEEKYFTKMANQELGAFCLTEPEAGSDAASIKTKAEKDGNDWVINGTKRFITSGGVADYYGVWAVTGPGKGSNGISLFYMDKETDGISVGKIEEKMGIRGSQTAEMIFEDVRVSQEHMCGPKGKGLKLAFEGLDLVRCGLGGLAVGLAQVSLDKAIQYMKERHQFGRPIAQFQALQFMVANLAMNIEAARALTYQTSSLYDSGYKGKDLITKTSMTKCFATDMCMRVTTDVVQIFGGYGYMKDYPVERMMRDAKILQIIEGTSQIHHHIIGRNLLA
jgi:alkylation response protein AidB-like acyl-CoA dehydrogenase